MSIYISGKDMPKSCWDCSFYVEEYDGAGVFDCAVTDSRVCKGEGEGRHEDCPLVPVPEHGRLIDADALMKMCGMATDCYDCPNGEYGWCKRSQDAANICEAIDNAPTIIQADQKGEL